MPRPRRRLLAGVAAALAVLAVAPAANAASPIPQSDCFWQTRTSSMFDTAAESNYAFPDSGAIYWSAKITMPAGSRIVLKGRFAHARYQSLNSYNKSNNAPVDALNDVSTNPDPGSTNPYRPGAKRTAKKRSYTINVLNTVKPATDRAPNTLYAGVDGQADQLLLMRIYVPDSFKRRDLTGGVGLPQVELHLADGSVQTGAAACASLNAQGGLLSVTTLPEAAYSALRNSPYAMPGFPAAATPLWHTYYNTGFIIQCWYRGDCSGAPPRIGGQYSNIDNEYVASFVNRSFPAGPVLVLRGKLPTTPRTGPKVRRMGRGQMRYWSVCQNESLFTTRGAGCVFDSQIPVDNKGRYTIVSSLAADRPKNATSKCGVAYLPWPENGDGAGNLNDGFLVVRNMLPSPTFKHAVQNTATPGDEAQVMGPYLPKGTYTTKASFQKRGC
ncbi:MAG: hypothetical protein QOF76_1084 [Solirubrobacteraceae bacterium]|jgi:hypothetical protein|nr:hypothetical protein [Solirubrobacteraceae bacterium]